jgi:recombinational DNA repair protein (RecF pathway)
MIDYVMLAFAATAIMSVVPIAYALGKVEHVHLVSRIHLLQAMKKHGLSLNGAACVACGKQITEENISSVVKYNGVDHFICKDLRCNALADVYVKKRG